MKDESVNGKSTVNAGGKRAREVRDLLSASSFAMLQFLEEIVDPDSVLLVGVAYPVPATVPGACKRGQVQAVLAGTPARGSTFALSAALRIVEDVIASMAGAAPDLDIPDLAGRLRGIAY